MDEIILNVKGMMCAGCENRIKNAVENIEGVKSAIANHNTGKVTVTLDSLDLKQKVEQTIEDIGFEVVKEN